MNKYILTIVTYKLSTIYKCPFFCMTKLLQFIVIHKRYNKKKKRRTEN